MQHIQMQCAEGSTLRLAATLALLMVLPPVTQGQSDTIQTDVLPLKSVYDRDFHIGCLLSYRHIGFPDDPPVPGQSAVVAPNGGRLIQFHMNSMSPGNNMKPMYTVDIPGSAAAYAAAVGGARDSIETHPIVRFNGDMIAQLNWAQRQGFTFRGHTLVWHSQTPAELFRSGYVSGGARLSKGQMTARMENYIKEVMRLIHEGWPGMLSAMDVVNEAVTDVGADRTAESEWYVTFGDNSYVMKAFELARRYAVYYGESQMKLYYNDYNTHLPAKAGGIARLCSPVFRAGYLDGIGMQEHDANSSPTAEAWISSYNTFDTVCTEMSVTELDVTTGSATPPAPVLAIQANQYGQLFKCFVERSYFSGRGKIISVSKDGLNDQYTFKTNQSSSLWDAENKCKPAFFAVVGVGVNYNALDSLIAVADTLQENRFTPESWASLTSALASARNARDRNYSNTVSADTSLRMAKDSLQIALNGLVTGIDGTESRTAPFALRQNFPNPFNPSTVIVYMVGNSDVAAVGRGEGGSGSLVKLAVYDLVGRAVAVLVHEHQRPGSYQVSFDGQQLASGTYVYRLTAGGFSQSRRMLLVR